MGNLNGFKPNKRVVKCSEVLLGEVQMGRSEVSTSVVKWSEDLNNQDVYHYLYIYIYTRTRAHTHTQSVPKKVIHIFRKEKKFIKIAILNLYQ